jgi:hypothetical protein
MSSAKGRRHPVKSALTRCGGAIMAGFAAYGPRAGRRSRRCECPPGRCEGLHVLANVGQWGDLAPLIAAADLYRTRD